MADPEGHTFVVSFKADSPISELLIFEQISHDEMYLRLAHIDEQLSPLNSYTAEIRAVDFYGQEMKLSLPV